MIIFSIFVFITLLFFGLGWFLCKILACPIKYNNWVIIKTGFYAGFSGQVIKNKFFKYYVKLYGKEENNTIVEKINYSGWAWWWNLEIREIPAEVIKEEFCRQIQPNTQSWNLVSTVPYSISTATSAISSSYSDLVSVEEEDNVKFL